MQGRDFYVLFASRFLRLFSYGALSVVLFNYLNLLGLSGEQVGTLLTGIILGDLGITLFLTTRADRYGRRRVLMLAAVLKLMTGLVFARSDRLWVLLIMGIIGVISPSGGEIGPFISIEQAALTELKGQINEQEVAWLFGCYNCFGYVAQAVGTLLSGLIVGIAMRHGYTPLQSNRIIIYMYASSGLLMLLLYVLLSSQVEATNRFSEEENKNGCLGIKKISTLRSLGSISLLFALDSFAGGFVMQSFLSFWFLSRWNVDLQQIGLVFLAVNVINGLSGIVSAKLVNRFGAVQTMVFTHLPSNILLFLIPIMGTQWAAIAMCLARFCISQMDVPARQAYIAVSVRPDERSAAAGITNVARSLGITFAPVVLGYLIRNGPSSATYNWPFFIAACLKIVYDILIAICYFGSRSIQQNSEHQAVSTTSHVQLGQEDLQQKEQDQIADTL